MTNRQSHIKNMISTYGDISLATAFSCTKITFFGFGPGGLCAPPEVVFAMCSWPLLVQACLRVPPVVADEAKLPLFSPTSEKLP